MAEPQNHGEKLKPKKHTGRTIAVWIIVIIAFVLVVGALNPDKSDESNKDSKVNSSQTAAKKTDDTKKPVEKKDKAAKKDSSKPKTTMDKLWVAVDDSIGNRDGISISYDSKAKSAELIHYESTFINTNDTIGEAYRDFVQWGQKIKDMPGVEQIDVATKTDFTDSYGKTDKENACEIVMATKDFKKYNWDNLNGQPIHNQLNQSGYLIIHPAIRKQVDLNDIKLSY